MARNGSGVYSLAGAFPSNGDVSDVTDITTNFTDLETDANTARPVVAGGTGATTEKGARNNLLFAKGSDVASASALSLGADGNYFDVTGNVAITSIATWNVGDIAYLHFDGALTLTHHATNLILPGGANITTAAGDEAAFVEYASGTWRCISYFKAASGALFTAIDGVAIGGTTPAAVAATSLTTDADIIHAGDTDNKISFTTDTQTFQTGGSTRMDITDSGVQLGGSGARVTTVINDDTLATASDTELCTAGNVKAFATSAAGMSFISSQDAATSATLDFTGFDSSLYDAYLFVLSNIRPATDGVNLHALLSNDGGSTYRASADYDFVSGNSESGGSGQNGGAAQNFIRLNDGGQPMGNLADEALSGRVWVYGPHISGAQTRVTANNYYKNSGGVHRIQHAGGDVLTAEANNAIRFLMSSGNITSGTITMYGLRNA